MTIATYAPALKSVRTIAEAIALGGSLSRNLPRDPQRCGTRRNCSL